MTALQRTSPPEIHPANDCVKQPDFKTGRKKTVLPLVCKCDFAYICKEIRIRTVGRWQIQTMQEHQAGAKPWHWKDTSLIFVMPIRAGIRPV